MLFRSLYLFGLLYVIQSTTFYEFFVLFFDVDVIFYLYNPIYL